MPGSHFFDDLGSATFTMLFTVALFNCLLLIPAVLAVPSALGASIAARRREARQSQLNNRLEQTTSTVYNNTAWSGSVLTPSNVRSTGYSAAAIDLIHILFYIIGEFNLCHRDVHRPYCIGFDWGFCLRMGWYRWFLLSKCSSPDWCHFHRFFRWSTPIRW